MQAWLWWRPAADWSRSADIRPHADAAGWVVTDAAPALRAHPWEADAETDDALLPPTQQPIGAREAIFYLVSRRLLLSISATFTDDGGHLSQARAKPSST